MAIIILLMVITAIFADIIAPYDPYEISQRLQFNSPSLEHWFGTDEFGRDLFTRIVYGARVALFIGLTAAFVGATGGAILGVTSAYLGGKVDLFLQRLIDVMLAFPLLILALAIVTVLGRIHSQCGAGHRHPHHSSHRAHRPLQCPEHQRTHLCGSGSCGRLLPPCG